MYLCNERFINVHSYSHIYLSTHLPIYLPIYLFIHQPTCPFTYMSVYVAKLSIAAELVTPYRF